MKKNGFTLVELLAVIVLLGILMTIAIPSAFKLNNKVKGKAYNTKIDLIEQAANNYGQSNLSLIRKGTSITDPSKHAICTFNYADGKLTSVDYSERTSYSETGLPRNTETKKHYWCTKVTVDKLVGSSNLNWDEENQCNGRCTEDNRQYYDNIVINPVSGFIINKCDIYIYYRNKRVYSYFDKAKCDNRRDTPNESGNEYRTLR